MGSDFRRKMQIANAQKQTAAQQIKNVTDNRDYKNDGEEENKQLDQVTKEKSVPKTDQSLEVEEESSKEAIIDQNKGNEKYEIIAEKESGNIEKEKPGYSDYKGMRHKTVTLIPSFDRILKVRPRQLGYTKDSYFDLLLSEEIARVEKIKEEDMESHYLRIYQLCNKRFKESKERSNIRFSQRMLDFLEKETINSGVTTTAYLNYLIEKELKREEREGMRQRKG